MAFNSLYNIGSFLNPKALEYWRAGAFRIKPITHEEYLEQKYSILSISIYYASIVILNSF